MSKKQQNRIEDKLDWIISVLEQQVNAKSGDTVNPTLPPPPPRKEGD
ncbi:MAG: hypothetical protein Tsb0033_17250 [Winogradskyella sp.]